MKARARVDFRGGWTCRRRSRQTVAFCFAISCVPAEDPPTRWILGAMNPGQNIVRAIRRFGTPSPVRVRVELSPRCRTGVDQRTITVQFSMIPEQGRGTPTAREVWDNVPFRMATLTRLVGGCADLCIARMWHEHWEPRMLHAS